MSENDSVEEFVNNLPEVEFKKFYKSLKKYADVILSEENYEYMPFTYLKIYNDAEYKLFESLMYLTIAYHTQINRILRQGVSGISEGETEE